MFRVLRAVSLAIVIASSLLFTAGVASADTITVRFVVTPPTAAPIQLLRDITWE